jgi:hypothetical protein
VRNVVPKAGNGSGHLANGCHDSSPSYRALK